ncbi:hypothetical protein SAMN05661093_08717 [Kibdelosporangium aridum]|uniref:Uncharacterized protein n=1 Tax=Kibdelosporangium aridum TaxID=2030 RepID=A0A1Y5Y608_KIBAR|nr:hypothetical protein SAMN05661093_08717 [Kibdelosporangium aridum]
MWTGSVSTPCPATSVDSMCTLWPETSRILPLPRRSWQRPVRRSGKRRRHHGRFPAARRGGRRHMGPGVRGQPHRTDATHQGDPARHDRGGWRRDHERRLRGSPACLPIGRCLHRVEACDCRIHKASRSSTAHKAFARTWIAFLDPFGSALDHARLCFGALRSRPGRAPTEVLLHSVSARSLGSVEYRVPRTPRPAGDSPVIDNLISRNAEA